jgi:hypothetical protein
MPEREQGLRKILSSAALAGKECVARLEQSEPLDDVVAAGVEHHGVDRARSVPLVVGFSPRTGRLALYRAMVIA